MILGAVAGSEIALDPFIALELVGPQAGHRVSGEPEKAEEQAEKA